MFSRKDFETYCSQMIAVEHKMEKMYRDMSLELKRADYKVIFRNMADDEVNHSAKIKELLAVLSAGIVSAGRKQKEN